MSISDKFTFQNSLETDENEFIFDSKQFVYVPDQNNGHTLQDKSDSMQQLFQTVGKCLIHFNHLLLYLK